MSTEHVHQPVVTVIAPCYQQERFVESTIASVRSQTEQRWELIVVDDGSSDASVAVASAAAGGDPRIGVLELPHQGVSQTRNAGIARASATSRYLLFLDADDELEPSMLERFVRELDAEPHLSMAHSLITLVDESGHTFPGPEMPPRHVADGWGVRALRDTELETPFESILTLAGIIPSCCVIRRSAFDGVGGWDETFGQGFEDTDLFLRLALAGPVRLIPERLVRHRRHAAQSSQAPGRHATQIVKLRTRWRDLDRLAPEDRTTVRDAWRFYDRQFTWFQGWTVGRRLAREGRPVDGARHVAGAVRRALTSWLAPSR